MPHPTESSHPIVEHGELVGAVIAFVIYMVLQVGQIVLTSEGAANPLNPYPIALAAVVTGWILGYLLAQLLGMTVFNAAISLRLPVLPITLVLSLLVAVLAAIVPVRRAVSVEPAKVLKGE